MMFWRRPVDLFIDRLDGRIRRSGGGYTAQCPAHEDRSPSLSFREGDDGRVLFHCFAGCAARDVLDALGLTWTDLFPARDDWSTSSWKGSDSDRLF